MPIAAASVTTAFRLLSGKVKLSLLDTDFQNLVDFLNATASYTNYLVDSGAVNALSVAFAGGLNFTMAPGQLIYVLVANDNTGASTIVVNGSTADAIVHAGGAALSASDILAGYVYPFVRLAASWQLVASNAAGGTGLTNSNFVDAEVPAGTIDGGNAVFTLAHAPSPAASLELFKNGVAMRPGGVDYTLSAGVTVTYTTLAKPQSGDTHVCWYRKA